MEVFRLRRREIVKTTHLFNFFRHCCAGCCPNKGAANQRKKKNYHWRYNNSWHHFFFFCFFLLFFCLLFFSSSLLFSFLFFFFVLFPFFSLPFLLSFDFFLDSLEEIEQYWRNFIALSLFSLGWKWLPPVCKWSEQFQNIIWSPSHLLFFTKAYIDNSKAFLVSFEQKGL